MGNSPDRGRSYQKGVLSIAKNTGRQVRDIEKAAEIFGRITPRIIRWALRG
jgi:hypothetical protein